MKPGSEQPITKVNADRNLAIAGIVVSILLLVIASTVYQSLLLQQISITVLLASGIYLLMRRYLKSRQIEEDGKEVSDSPLLSRLNPHISKVLDISFWGLFIAGITILWQSVYERPLSFLILVAVMCSILAVEIAAKKNTAYCLIKIMVIGLLIRGSAYYQFATVVGTDPFIEIDFVEQLVASGQVGEFFGVYVNYPMSYILDASILNITGLGFNDSFFILVAIQVISLVFIFLIGKELFNEETGLLSALIIAVFDWHIFWGFYVKGMVLGIALVPAIIWLLLVGLRKGGRLRFSIITIVMLGLIIITHTYVNAALALILALGLISALICRLFLGKEGIKVPTKLNLVLLFLIGTLAYWMYASGFITYIGNVVRYAMSIDAITIEEVGAQPIMYRNTALLTWQKLPTLILSFFFVFGFLNILGVSRLGQRKFLQTWIALVGGMLLVFNFVLFYIPAFGILEVARWHVFVGMLVVFPAVVGLLKMAGRRGWPKMVGLFLLVFLISGIFLTSHISSVVTVVPWEQKIRMAYTSSEMSAADTVSRVAGFTPGQNSVADSKIYTDYYYLYPLWYKLELPRDEVLDASPIFLGEAEAIDGIIILRQAVTYEVVGATYEGYGRGEFTMDSVQYQLFVDDPQYSLIYNCGTVTALKPSGSDDISGEID
jgi:hypothetical protein